MKSRSAAMPAPSSSRVNRRLGHLVGGLEAAVLVDRAHQRLERIGQDRALLPAAGLLLAAAEKDPLPQRQPLGHAGQAGLVDHGGALLRQLALGVVGKPTHQQIADHQRDDRVAQELQPLVVAARLGGPFVQPGLVGQRGLAIGLIPKLVAQALLEPGVAGSAVVHGHAARQVYPARTASHRRDCAPRGCRTRRGHGGAGSALIRAAPRAVPRDQPPRGPRAAPEPLGWSTLAAAELLELVPAGHPPAGRAVACRSRCATPWSPGGWPPRSTCPASIRSRRLARAASAWRDDLQELLVLGRAQPQVLGHPFHALPGRAARGAHRRGPGPPAARVPAGPG